MSVDVKKDIEVVIKEFKANMKDEIKYLSPFAQYVGATIGLKLLPGWLIKYMIYEMSMEVHFLFSNLNASKKDFSFGGKKSKEIMFSAGGTGRTCNIFSMTTVNGKTSFSYACDEKVMKNP